jgi:NNP family nitrate/nitrite transporter-like MFS transporter
MSERGKAGVALAGNTVAFTVCFAVWVMNGVLVTYLVDNGLFRFNDAQIGLLIGVPILTGSLLRLPLGILTDRFGGRPVFGVLMLLAAVPTWLVSRADSYADFLLAGLGFGVTGASFAVGVAFTSVWFGKDRQGTALGVFGAGNTGAALTRIFAPFLLLRLTAHGENLEGWRTLPRLYAAALVVTAVAFLLLTTNRKPAASLTLGERLRPLGRLRVWRFGLYYSLVFGGFVALSQWLIPYYVNAYFAPVTTAGLLAAGFSLPAGLVRAAGGWMSDRWGGRAVMVRVLAGCALCFALLVVPRMTIESPGRGVMAARAGVVETVDAEQIVVGGQRYPLARRGGEPPRERGADTEGVLVFPTRSFRQEPVVAPGERVAKRQLLARGVTSIYFQANLWIFTGLVLLAGLLMGIGSAAVFKLIPDYFPDEVGVVGGLVGVLGGLGGFLFPILFGSLLQATGLWTSCWMFLAALALVCLLWLNAVAKRVRVEQAPLLERQLESAPEPASAGAGRRREVPAGAPA